MKSGMLAAEASFKALNEGADMEMYWDSLKKSWIWEELYKARNYRPAFEYGLVPGLAFSALEHHVFKGRFPLTLKHGKPDHEATEMASLHKPIEYPKPDGVLSFDVPTSLYRSNTNHEHDQPVHLRLKDPTIPKLVNFPKYAGLESRYCPARVYEYVTDEKGNSELQINAQNCLHCKVSIGLVIALNYHNPFLSPFEEFQGSDLWHNQDRFRKFACASLQLCKVYMEIASSTGSRQELLMAEMHLRNSIK